MHRVIYLAVLMAGAVSIGAHGPEPRNWQELRGAWEFQPVTTACLAIFILFYLRGHWLVKRASPSYRRRRNELLFFVAGMISLGAALLSPLHPWGKALFSIHMAQHEILMLVSAPLLVLANPLLYISAAAPMSCSRTLEQWLHGRIWRQISRPFNAWAIHGAILWLWHAPLLFQAATENDFAHALQHSTFFGSAVLFWWALFHGKSRKSGYGMAILYMFTTAVHSGALGALLTVSRQIWYPIYSTRTLPWGLSPLEDQQLGGLIMWIPAGLVYLGVSLFLFAGWIAESERKSYPIAGPKVANVPAQQ